MVTEYFVASAGDPNNVLESVQEADSFKTDLSVENQDFGTAQAGLDAMMHLRTCLVA